MDEKVSSETLGWSNWDWLNEEVRFARACECPFWAERFADRLEQHPRWRYWYDEPDTFVVVHWESRCEDFEIPIIAVAGGVYKAAKASISELGHLGDSGAKGHTTPTWNRWNISSTLN